MKQRRLLVVDDEADITDIVAEVAGDLGFQVTAVNQAEGFEAAFLNHDPHVLVLDLNMPGQDGIEVLRFLGDCHCRAGILIISGLDTRTLASADRLGKTHGLHMLGALQKPLDITVLEEALSRSVTKPE